MMDRTINSKAKQLLWRQFVFWMQMVFRRKGEENFRLSDHETPQNPSFVSPSEI